MSTPDNHLDPATIKHLLGTWTAPNRMLSAALADGLADLITTEQLPPGAQLPPSRRLAAALNTSRTTITSVYEILQAQGLLHKDSDGHHIRPPARHTTPTIRSPIATPDQITAPAPHRQRSPDSPATG